MRTLNKNIPMYAMYTTMLLGCSAGSSTTNSSCPYPTFSPQIAQQLLTNWGVGLNTYNLVHNPDVYTSAGYFSMSFYAPDGILQPTKSPIQREGTEEIYDYFTNFLSSNPVMTFNPESAIAKDLGCGFGSYVGYYNFVTNPGTFQESTVNARFTFIYEYIDTGFQESFIAESGPSNGTTFMQVNQPGWYIYVQQSSALPTY